MDGQEFCEVVCKANAVQIKAHQYALGYVERLQLGSRWIRSGLDEVGWIRFHGSNFGAALIARGGGSSSMVHSTDLPLDDTPQKRSSKLGRGDSAQLRHPKVRPAEMGQQRWDRRGKLCERKGVDEILQKQNRGRQCRTFTRAPSAPQPLRLGECYEADMRRARSKSRTPAAPKSLHYESAVPPKSSPQQLHTPQMLLRRSSPNASTPCSDSDGEEGAFSGGVVPTRSKDRPGATPSAFDHANRQISDWGSRQVSDWGGVRQLSDWGGARQVSEFGGVRQVSEFGGGRQVSDWFGQLPQGSEQLGARGSEGPETGHSEGLGKSSPGSPASGLGAMMPLECWLHRPKSATTNRSTLGPGSTLGLGGPSNKNSRTGSADVMAKDLLAERWRSCTLSPTGHFRNLWDFLGIILLVFDAVTLPVQFVTSGFYVIFPALSVVSKFQVLYWALDVLLSFFTGYLDKGNLIQSHKEIVCHYLKTWFLPDFIVTVIDIVLEFSGGEEASTDRASTRVLRLLRLLRVVRLGKLTRFASFLRDKFESEVAYTQFSLLLLIIGMMLQEHVIACGWFGIGSFSSEENTWLTVSKNEYSSFTLQYTHSLRWAFSQLGIGGTNIEAVNEAEGLYSVVVALVSLITFSSIISSMTSLVSTLQNKRMEQTQQFGLLRRFLRMNKISENLGQRITRFLHYTYHQRSANVDDPYILDFLSKSLQAELQLARYNDYLSKMPFLAAILKRSNTLSLQEGHVLQTLASQAISSHDFAEDDVLFCYGNRATAAYYVLQGSTLYLQNERTARSPPHELWICEMCLWTRWTHLGDLLSTSFCKILAVHGKEFCEIISKAGPVQVHAHKYATDYVEELNARVDMGRATDLSESKDIVARRTSIASLPLHFKGVLASARFSCLRGLFERSRATKTAPELT
ncbi:unnamed protein product [Durusdinium trenchii]|uniref:Ion transport domain-containing protein n=1 Tax=Durusdinium trenchii TaxID=1381693 RepID=A0ABP0KKD1_9DINO